MAENSNFLPTFFHIFGNLSLKDLAYLLLVAAIGHVALQHVLAAVAEVG